MDRRSEAPPYPQEPLRHWYVTPLGGHSPELDFYQVGILAEALRHNTDLRPGLDRVRIGVLGHRRTRPVLFDGFFEVVPLDEGRPDARRKSPSGEAVLPEGNDVIRAGSDPPQPGDDLVLNGVLARSPWGTPGHETIAAVLEEFLRERMGESTRAN